MLFLCTGISDCVLALGFEKMERGSLGTKVCVSLYLLIIEQLFLMYVLCTKEGSNLNEPQIEAIYNSLTHEQFSIMQACLVVL